ncbi:MAG: hypothetical protein QXP27_07930 [Candidatus Methanomethyliaceae archaeon]
MRHATKWRVCPGLGTVSHIVDRVALLGQEVKKVRDARKRTRYGIKTLPGPVTRRKLALSHSIYHILRRQGLTGGESGAKPIPSILGLRSRKALPLRFEVEVVKDILDKTTLGPKLWDHLCKTGLSCSQ